MHKFYLCGILLFACFQLGAQEAQFPESTLATFTKIYLAQKANRVDTQEAMLQLFDRYQLSKERYAAILKKSLTGDKAVLSTSEEAFLIDLETLKKTTIERKRSGLKSLCDSRQFSFSLYQQIEARYKSDLSFQRSLKSFFEQEMKGK